MEIFTIGHSNHSIDTFIALIKKHGITAIADVRSHPYSRYLPHFSQSALKSALLNAEIQYVFLGRELGARSADQSCYIDGKAVYEKIAATELFAQGIERLIKGSQKYKISLMCAEQDPIECHRAVLVCQHLRKFDLDIYHILKNSELESHQHLEERILVLHGLNHSEEKEEMPKQLSLFDEAEITEVIEQRAREDCLLEAYKLQGDKIAYVEKKSILNDQES